MIGSVCTQEVFCMPEVFYLYNENVRKARNEAGEDYTPAYIPCLLSWMGVTGHPVSSGEATSLRGEDILLAGCEDLSADLADCVRKLSAEDHVSGPGAILLFGSGCGAMPVRTPGIRANLFLNGDTIPLFVPICDRAEDRFDGKTEICAEGCCGSSGKIPAIVRCGRVYDFRFDLPGTVWFAGDGFSDGKGKNGFSIGRTPDTRPLPDDMAMPFPFNDRLLFFVESILNRLGVPMIDRLPPTEDGTAPDFALHVSGDDDFTSARYNLEAARRMAELDMPYHINAMPGGERFVITREEAEELKALGCELALHTDFTAQPYSLEGQTVSCDLFERYFGFRTLTGTNHCFIQGGSTAERLRWLGECGVIADNGKDGEVDPENVNAFNITGFSFGTAFPRFTLDDPEHENRPLSTIEIPINYYEPRLGNGYDDPGRITAYIDNAAAEGRITQFFCHPHYLEPDSAHTPATLAALRLAFGHAKAKEYRILKTSTDRIARFWHSRAESSIESDAVRADETAAYLVRSEIPVLIRLPISPDSAVFSDGIPVSVTEKNRAGNRCFLVFVPKGEHRISW